MTLNDQSNASTLMPVMREAMRRAGIAAATAAMGVGTASAQMTPAQPAPAPMPATATTQGTGGNDAMFKRVDADGDGFVTKAELEKVDAILARTFDKYDIDKDGKLSMMEFDAMMKGVRHG